MSEFEQGAAQPIELPAEKTITLRKTITLGAGADQIKYDEITLREPTVDEIEKFIKKLKGTNEIDAMRYFVALITGLLPTVIGQMGARDWNEAQEFIQAFFPSSGSLAIGNS
ncbi:hypothetical protein R69746_05665 [Paraburkholderia aspalathi]|uniref:phage tail assembly protein n=1 Tax=Paraburkholderia aspalathi TaxID=1324617 RepID=UPI001909CD67|nr:phage tail assembly protein [Paraburkholderia aspalathi]MBK3841713.1 phage tail assembly protein [Paraburkholderia aspalathi]CAE6811985.1 hypothetical protein R69746_05665 [Paraburkholderia aspalathi]